jgi:hypothetical protein
VRQYCQPGYAGGNVQLADRGTPVCACGLRIRCRQPPSLPLRRPLPPSRPLLRVTASLALMRPARPRLKRVALQWLQLYTKFSSPPMSVQTGIVKAVLSGDTIVVMGPSKGAPSHLPNSRVGLPPPPPLRLSSRSSPFHLTRRRTTPRKDHHSRRHHRPAPRPPLCQRGKRYERRAVGVGVQGDGPQDVRRQPPSCSMFL